MITGELVDKMPEDEGAAGHRRFGYDCAHWFFFPLFPDGGWEAILIGSS